jgi:predicted nucleic acid-binding protein
MSNAEYLIQRAHQELKAAIRASDERVRDVHLELADAYAFQLSETRRQEQSKPFS